jgi:hypothetical protein
VLEAAFYRAGTARGERTREVTGRRRVESVNGDGSLKLKREWHGRGTGGASLVWLGWGGSGAEGERFRVARVARWPSTGFSHDGRKGTTGPTGPSWAERLSGPGALGRPISDKKRKENRNRLGCQGLLGQNQIGPVEENANYF